MIAAAERHKVSGALGVSGEPGAVVMWDTADTLPTCRQWKERFLRLLRTTAITHEKKRSEGKNRLEVWSHFEPSPNEDKTSKSSVKEQEATEHSNLSPFQCFSSDVSRCNWNLVFRFLGFCGRKKIGEQRVSKQGREPAANWTQMYRRVWKSNLAVGRKC